MHCPRVATGAGNDGGCCCCRGKDAGTYEFFPTAYEIDMQMLCEVFPGVNNSYTKKRKTTMAAPSFCYDDDARIVCL